MARLDEYVLGDRLGTGGVGVVYQARRRDSDSPLVVKFLRHQRQDGRSVRRFRDEAIAGRLVTHPNVAAVVDDGWTNDGRPFLVMERARGESLGHLITRSRTLSVAEAIAIAREILAGLAAIHASGIVHADIKSDNVIVDSVDGHHAVKLIDFGLARVQFFPESGSVAHEAEWLSGTPEYMAPEIVRGYAACFASDLYAVGVILYEMLTGSTPFAGGSPSDIVRRHVGDDVVLPSLRREAGDVSALLDSIVMRALSKDPEGRYPSATEMSAALGLVGARKPPSTAKQLYDHADERAPTLAGWSRQHFAKGTPARAGAGRVRRPR